MSLRQLHLNAFLMGVGHHESAWRHPGTDPSILDDAGHFQRLAQIAERGTFDSVFLADGVQVRWAVAALRLAEELPQRYRSPIGDAGTAAGAGSAEVAGTGIEPFEPEQR